LDVFEKTKSDYFKQDRRRITAMQIIGIIIWVFGVLYALGWGLNIREKAKNEQATEHTFELHALLLAVSVIITPALSLSPFHLLWMLPASFVLGLASVIFPLNLLWLPASLYGSLWYIGTRDPGRAFYLAGNYTKAIEYYKETVRLRPNSAEARFYLGLAYDKAGDKEKAIESYKEVIKLEPSSWRAYCNLGLSYKDLGDYEKAIESFKEAIHIKPNYDRARRNLGMDYVEVGDSAKALKEYEVLRKSNETYAAELYSVINAKN
jgi:tetratricopeptide (TPR) repeat protein